MSDFREKRISSKSRGVKNADEKIGRHSRRYEDEEQDSESESQDSGMESETSSENEGQYESERDEDENVDGRSSYTYEKIERQPEALEKKKKTFEQKINIDSLAISKEDKDALKDDCVIDYLSYKISGSLGELKSSMIELRHDRVVSPSSLNAGSENSNQLSEIKAILITKYQNTFPVDIAGRINGVKDATVAKHRGSGVVSDLLFNAEEESRFEKGGRLIVCPTKKTGSEFLERNPDVTIHTINSSYHEVKGSDVCLMTEGSHLHKYIEETFPEEQLNKSKKGYYVVGTDLKNKAVESIQKELDTKNICSLNNISITINRAAKGQKSNIAEWHDLTEITDSIGKQATEKYIKERQETALHSLCRLSVELKVIHKPIKN